MSGDPDIRKDVRIFLRAAVRRNHMPAKPRACQRCGSLIPVERLEALPETRLCIACSQAVGGDFDVTAVSENLSKSGSLKKNYGGWTIHKKRKPIRPVDE
jgi:hypothetical protein